MPITGQTDPTDKPTVTIPQKYRKYAAQIGWPFDTWTVYESNIGGWLDAFKAAYQADQGGGGDGNQDITINVTGGGSGGGGGGGYAGMSPEQKRNLREAYIAILHDWGIAINGNMNNLMSNGVNQEWSTTAFINHLRGTKEYKAAFPGILKGQAESTYLGAWDTFRTIAASHGLTLKKSQFGTLNKHNVGATEWDMRATFAERAERNKEFFNYLETAARRAGILKPNEKFKQRDMWEIMTGRGSRPVEKLVEQANAQMQLAHAGITVGRGGDITRQQFTKFLRQAEGQGIEAEYFDATTFAGLAERIRTVIPAADRVGAGITKGDLFTLETNGRGADRIARQAEQILNSWEKEKQANVNPILVEEEAGKTRLLGGSLAPPKSY
jgi:hypothetical protein